MENPFDFYIPVREATVFCHSKLLDDIGDFTKFVIWNLGMRKKISDIDQVLQLPSGILKEEFNYLRKHELSVGSAEAWELTPLGLEYFSLLKCMDDLEKYGIPVYIDMFSGDLVLRKNEMTVIPRSLLPTNALSVSPDHSISDVFFRNDNYGNSLEFVQVYLREARLLEERYMSSLYTTMDVPKADTLFLKCHVDSYEYDRLPQKRGLKMAVPIAVVTYKKYYSQLDEFRSVLDTLRQLREYGNGLLSEKALRIEEVYRQECAELELVYCFDLFSRQRIRETWDPNLLVNSGSVGGQCLRLPAQEFCFELYTKNRDIFLKPTAADKEKVLICDVPYCYD